MSAERIAELESALQALTRRVALLEAAPSDAPPQPDTSLRVESAFFDGQMHALYWLTHEEMLWLAPQLGYPVTPAESTAVSLAVPPSPKALAALTELRALLLARRRGDPVALPAKLRRSLQKQPT